MVSEKLFYASDSSASGDKIVSSIYCKFGIFYENFIFAKKH